MSGKHKGEKARTVAASIVCFFGAAFTLMAYHNDVSIAVVFQQFYESLLGPSQTGLTEVEICYCIGIVLGPGGYIKNAF